MLNKLLDPLPVCRVEQAQIIFKLDRDTDTVRNNAADLAHPIIALVCVGADEHIDTGGRAVLIGGIGVERNQLAVALRKVIVVIHRFIDLFELVLAQRHQLLHAVAAGVLEQAPGKGGTFLFRVGQCDRAALGNHAPKQPFCLADNRQQRYTAAAGRLAEDGDIVRITRKGGNILLHPPECLNLV